MNDIYHIYREALRIRLIEEAIAAKYNEQEMRCPTHLSIGQELPPTIVSSFLSPKDKVYSSHRAHAHYLAKGGDLKKLIAELYGKKTGCTGGRGGSMHLTDLSVGFIASTAIVGNSIPLAVGNALHQKRLSPMSLTVSYFGEGATEEGAFYEAVNFAVVKNLPILFACENNRYSVYSSLNVRQPPQRHIFELAKAIGVRSFHTNGNELPQCYAATNNAIDHIRTGKGPAFIEYETYRHREHCGPNFDDDLNYRPPQEVEHWLKADPINLLETTLSDLYKPTIWAKKKANLRKAIHTEIEDAFTFAKQSPFGDPSDNMEFLYAK